VLAGAFAFGEGWFEGVEARANTKMRPVLVRYYARSWRR